MNPDTSVIRKYRSRYLVLRVLSKSSIPISKQQFARRLGLKDARILEYLIKENLITKEKSRYSITEKGKEYLKKLEQIENSIIEGFQFNFKGE